MLSKPSNQPEKLDTLFAIHFHPYTFRNASRPHGFSYCLRAGTKCIAHGIVFAECIMSIVSDLLHLDTVLALSVETRGIVAGWARGGSVPFLPADRPIGHFGACHRKPVYHSPDDKWRWAQPPASATDAERRIFEARRAAAEKRQTMKGHDHV